VEDLPKLLDFIVKKSSTCSHVKWIVSSRNWPTIEKGLKAVVQNVKLQLELNEQSVSAAVATYIQYKVNWLAERNIYGNDTRDAVQRYLLLNANGTFLWVALVCQELSDVSGWQAKQIVTIFPPGLDAFYRQMLDHIGDSRNAKLCKSILGVVSAVYRPITLDELASFIDMPDGVSGNFEALSEIIALCGSFLTLRECTIYFVHQSAKDFLLKQACHDIFPSGIEDIHRVIFSRSLQAMSKTLHRDMYNLHALAYPAELVEQPDQDPLAALRYSCIYWIDHLCDWNPDSYANHKGDLKDGGAVDSFIKDNYLYWLEALSLCRSMSKGVVSIAKLEALIQVIIGSAVLYIYSTC
jgi:hypothetical protein